MKTKIIIWLFLSLPAVVQAQFNFITNNLSITITGYTGSAGAVVIPDTTNGYPVTSIGPGAFSMHGFITSLTMGTNVTSIGSGAFENCTSLTNMTIPDNVTTIGDDAFHWCDSLATVTMGTNVTSIGAYAFYGCGSLTSVTIPSSVTSIGVEAFACIPDAVGWPASLTAINVDTNNPDYSSVAGVLFNKSQTTLIQCPAGLAGSYAISNRVFSIGDYAFDFCNRLTNVTIPNSVTNIGRNAFSECSSLTSVTIGTNVTSIAYAAFFDCNSLTNVTIPASVTSLAEFAFGPCASLTAIDVDTNNPAYCSVAGVLFNKSKTTLVQFPAGLAGSYTIPNGVTNIGDAAFYVCASLTNLTAPSSLTNIGEYGFAYCFDLTGICFQGNAPSLGYDDFYASPVTIYYLPSTSGWVGTTYGGYPLVAAYPQITVQPQSSTASLGTTASFSVTVTGAAPLAYQWSKDTINLLNAGSISGVTNSILTINNAQLTNAGSYALVVTNAYGSMTSSNAVLTVTLSSPVTDFNFATNGDGSITITGYHGSGGWVIIPNPINGRAVVSIAGFTFYSWPSLTNVTIPGSVTTIAGYAFYSCSSLTNVNIGSGVTNIANQAFSYCSGLTAITVDASNPAYSSLAGTLFDKGQTTLIQYPNGLAGSYAIPGSATSIGDSAFQNCASLSSVVIPDGVTNIGNSAFNSCTSLTQVNIPNSVINIGSSAFYSCTSLTNVNVGSGVTTIGSSAFGYCSSLTAINVDSHNLNYSSLAGILFNKGKTTLLQCPNGLAGSYVIPGSVTTIGNSAFANCASLTQVTIANNVSSISDSAFANCTRLANIVIPNSVTSIGNFAFSSCSSLASVTIPNSITSISNSVFESCTGLTNVMIPNSVTSIGGMAFFFCSGLTNVTIPGSVTSISGNAFGYCGNLKGVYFQGNAPGIPGGMFGMSGIFNGDTSAIAYYLPGTTGWGSSYGSSGSNGSIPTAQWMLPYPLVLNNGPGFGVQSNCFSFTISWATNLSVVVEATTNLAKPVWTPLATNSLTSGTNYFSDSQWMNYPSRFYRVHSQ